MAKKIRFDRIFSNLRQFKSTIPIRIGGMYLRHFKSAFDDEGFTDRRYERWTPRKKRDRNERVFGRRKILQKTARLKRSLRVREANFSRIRVGSYGVEYATAHNRGEDPQPQRQFVGDSEKVRREIRNLVRQEMKKIFR